MKKISKGEQSKIIKAWESHPIGDFDDVELLDWYERIDNSLPKQFINKIREHSLKEKHLPVKQKIEISKFSVPSIM